MTEALKPCPFCGGKAHVLSEKTHNGGRKFRVGCYDPCCSGAAFEGAVFFDKSEAVDAWNRRVERTCRYVYDEVLCGWVCSECGGLEPVGDHVRYCPDCGARVVEKDE